MFLAFTNSGRIGLDFFFLAVVCSFSATVIRLYVLGIKLLVFSPFLSNVFPIQGHLQWSSLVKTQSFLTEQKSINPTNTLHRNLDRPHRPNMVGQSVRGLCDVRCSQSGDHIASRATKSMFHHQMFGSCSAKAQNMSCNGSPHLQSYGSCSVLVGIRTPTLLREPSRLWFHERFS